MGGRERTDFAALLNAAVMGRDAEKIMPHNSQKMGALPCLSKLPGQGGGGLISSM